jgi:hypothetical protein
MMFESRRSKEEKKNHFVTWKAYFSYFSSCSFFISLFPLNFKDDFTIFLIGYNEKFI